MENRAYALAAGLFTLLLGIGVVAAALWFSGDTVENDEYLLVSRYPVSGLNAQAPVRYRGVTVGKVVDINFDPNDPRAILVRIQVRTGTPLSQGTYAQLGSQGVTGLAYVMLDDDGKKPGQLVGEGDQLARIEVRPSFIDSLSASGQDMIVNFNQVAQRVNTLLSDDNQKQLVGTLRNLDQATRQIRFPRHRDRTDGQSVAGAAQRYRYRAEAGRYAARQPEPARRVVRARREKRRAIGQQRRRAVGRHADGVGAAAERAAGRRAALVARARAPVERNQRPAAKSRLWP